jgi:hypothetical protein
MGAITSLATAGLNLALAQQSAQRQSRAIDADRDRQIAAIRQRDDEERRRGEDQLRRQLATQRARAAAAGVGSGGGSADAVLRGLIEESEAAQRAREQSSALRIDELRRRAQQSRRRNLLDLAGGPAGGALRSLGRETGRQISLIDL